LEDDGEVRVPLGRITAVLGLKGWVKIHSDTDPRDGIVRFPRWLLTSPGGGDGAGERVVEREIVVLEGRPQGKTVVARLEGIEDRDAAEALVGHAIAVRRRDLPPLGDRGFYWADLIGMRVDTVDGIGIGPVVRLFETGANDVLVVGDERDGSRSGSEILVPWIRPDVVVRVDRQARVIVVDWDPDF